MIPPIAKTIKNKNSLSFLKGSLAPLAGLEPATL